MLHPATGVTHHDTDRATPGHFLIAPVGGEQVLLVDMMGDVAHRWDVGHGFTFWSYLRPGGTLFVNERSPDHAGVALTSSGLMREYDWEGTLLWEHHDPFQHHDARRLDNGGAVYLAYTPMDPADQARVLGGIPGTETEDGIWGEVIREVDAAGQVVWEWSLDRLGFDATPLHPNANRWSYGHTNTIEVMPDGNYLISSKVMNLLFVVDRQSGAVIWRYQNDEMSGQHDAQVLENGNILIFANGAYSADLHHSQIWEIDPKTSEIVWRFALRDNPQLFFSPHIGGCQRLTSGNTLVCEGAKGCLFEVTPDGEVVWQYISPHDVEVPRFGHINWLFRARHYAPDAPELNGRPNA